MKLLLVLLATVIVGGCAANGYEDFYKSVASPEVVAARRASPPPEQPIVRRSSGAPNLAAYERQGYVPIGYSSFNSGEDEDEDDAIEQAQEVGADLVVIVNPTYTGSRTSSVPIVTPTTQTSYTSGSATAYGSGGSATAYGNATTTTYGSRTTYIPITVNRYDFGAVYFVKLHFTLGVSWRPLKPEERQALQTNKGLYVLTVINGSPAFKADILHGDIIESIADTPIGSVDSANSVINKFRGQSVPIKLIRAGNVIVKNVVLNK